MTNPKRPHSAIPALRTEIDVAHATLDRVPDLIGRGHNLTARVAAVVQRLDETKSRTQLLALGYAEFVNAIAEVFGLPVPTDREPTSALLLAELRKVREGARADRHNLHVAEGTIATMASDARIQQHAANAALASAREQIARLEQELAAAVEAMSKPDARDESALVATLASMLAVGCPTPTLRNVTPAAWIARARDAVAAARGQS